MAFNYATSSNVNTQPLTFGAGLNYGSPVSMQPQQAQRRQVDYGNQFPAQQQQQQQIDPQVVMKLVQQFRGGSAAGGESTGLLSQGSGSAGLGGSGLIGSASGATAAASNGGASYGLGGSLVGGSGTVGGSTFAAGSGAGSGSAAGGSGLMGSLGGLSALAGLSYLGDKEMNESKGSIINADKLNDMGTIGDTGIGLRGGDLVNGFNPATWVSDPGKAAKGLVNVFTLGFLDKWL